MTITVLRKKQAPSDLMKCHLPSNDPINAADPLRRLRFFMKFSFMRGTSIDGLYVMSCPLSKL